MIELLDQHAFRADVYTVKASLDDLRDYQIMLNIGRRADAEPVPECQKKTGAYTCMAALVSHATAYSGDLMG